MWTRRGSNARLTAAVAAALALGLVAAACGGDDGKEKASSTTEATDAPATTAAPTTTTTTVPPPQFDDAGTAADALYDHVDETWNSVDGPEWVSGHGVTTDGDTVVLTISVDETTADAALAHCEELAADVTAFLGDMPYRMELESWVQGADGAFTEGDWAPFDCPVQDGV